MVVVVAFGLLLASTWSWWYFGEVTPVDGGWFAYDAGTEPDTSWYTVQDRRPEFLVVPVALILVWASTSIWLFGLRDDEDETHAARRLPEREMG